MKILLTLALTLPLVLVACSGKDGDATKHNAKADAFHEKGDYAAARIEYLNALKANPSDPHALGRLGMIWMDRGSITKAFRYLHLAKQSGAKDAEVLFNHAAATIALGDMTKGVAALDSLLEASPTYDKALVFRCQIARTEEEITALREQITAVEDSHPATYFLCAGTLALHDKDLTGATELLEKSLAADNTTYLSSLALARIHLADGDLEEAEQYFKQALPHLPMYSATQLQYPQFLIQKNDLPGARAAIDSLIEKAPDFLPALHFRATIQFREEDYQGSLASLQEVLALDPEYLDSLILKAQALRADGQLEEARKHLKSALTIPYLKNHPRLHHELAQVELASDDPESALESTKRAIASPGADIETRLRAIRLLLTEGEAGIALAQLEPFRKAFPKDRQFRLLEAEAFWQLERFSEAAFAYQELIAEDDSIPLAHLRLASISQKNNDAAGERHHLESALALAPESADTLAALTELDLREGKPGDALDRVESLIKRNPESAQAYLLKGRVLHAQRDWAGAIAALQESLRLEPVSPPTAILLSSAAASSGNKPLAMETLASLTESEYATPSVLVTAALVYEQLEEFEAARKVHELVLAKDPDNAPSMNNLANLILKSSGDLEKAEELARKARAAAPNSAAVADTLGWVLYLQGDSFTAFTLFQEAARSLPENAEVQKHLGLAASMVGRFELAKTSLEAALAAADDDEVRRRLSLVEDVLTPEPLLEVPQLESLAAGSPPEPLAHLLLARHYEASGKQDDALAAARMALKAAPELAPAQYEIARLTSDLDEALAAVKRARELDPDNPRITALQGRFLLAQNEANQAHALLSESARQLGDDGRFQYDLAWSSFLTNHPDEARRQMGLAVSLGLPQSSTQALASEFLQLTDPDLPLADSAPLALKAIAEDRSDYQKIPALLVVARHQADAGDDSKAEATLRGVLKLFPSLQAAQRELAILLSWSADSAEEASQLATKLREGGQDDAGVAAALARTAHFSGDHAYAVQLFKNSRGDSPLDPVSQCYFGLSLKATGDSAAAAEALKSALSSDLPGDLRAKAEEALAE